MANKGIKRNKETSIIKPRMGLMEKAHDYVVANFEEMTEPFGRVFQLTHGEETAQLMELKARMLARREVLEDFFEICREHMTFGMDEELQAQPQRIKSIYATEYLQVALRVREIISQKSNEAPIAKTLLNLMAQAHGHVLADLKEGAEQFQEFLFLNLGEYTDQMITLKALVSARRKVINAFFTICKTDHLELRISERLFESLPFRNNQLYKDAFLAEFQRLASKVRESINQAV